MESQAYLQTNMNANPTDTPFLLMDVPIAHHAKLHQYIMFG